MSAHPYQEAIEMLKDRGAILMHAYAVLRDAGQHDDSAACYNRGVAFNCAAQYLREGMPGGLAGPTPPRPAASIRFVPDSSPEGTPSRPETAGTSAAQPD